MGLGHSPQIITDGMVLYLDAANPKNYNLTEVEVLVVAGGGGGGMDMGGGGGGGGVIYSSSVSVTPGSAVSVTVGNGGAGAPAAGTNGQPSGHQYTISATQGGNSVFGALTAIGGGFGASSYYGYTPNSGVGGSGGSGGGCSGYTHGGERYVDSNGTPGQGYPGGNSGNPASGGDDHYSGGGGGAGGRGTSGPNHVAPSGVRADGGPGILYPTMSPYYFGGGGGGAAYTNSTGGYGGIGGGGGGAVGTTFGGAGLNNGSPGGGGGPNQWANTPGGNAGANTGGGGGGGSHYNANNKGGDGGSGIVIVKYQGPQKAIGGTVTSVGGYTIHTFTTVGSTTFTPLVATNNSAVLGLSDFSGRGNFGTTANSPTYSSDNGGSLVFDGTNDYVDLGSEKTLKSSGGWTVSSWINLSQVISGSLYNFIGSANIVHNSWYWTVYQSKLALWNISPGGWYYGSTTMQPNVWYNCVLVCSDSGTSYQMYLNGVAEGGTHTTYTWNASYAGLIVGYIGRGDSPNGRYFYGKYPQVSIYNRALSAVEIQQNYNALAPRFVGPPIVTDGLVLNLDAGNLASYPGSGTTWTDLSGVIGNVNINNRNNDWVFTTDPSTGNKCLYSDVNRVGSTSGINIPVNNGFNKLEGTIELFIKPTSHTGGNGWFNNSDGTTYTNFENWFWIGTWDNSSVLYFRQGNPGNCCNDLTISSFSASYYPLNVWSCWTITWKVSSGRATIYKNGIQQAQTTSLPTNIQNTNPTNTGQLFNGHTRGDNMQFRGYCNSYKIYNKELTAAEVSQNFNALRGRFGI